MREHSFVVPGTPRGKGRPRFFKRGGHVGTYTDDKTAAYENLVRLACGAVKGGPFTGPVRLTVRALFPIPKSWSKAKRDAAGCHTSKPDLDNVVKAVKDGLTGSAWLDDSLVYSIDAKKFYTHFEPRLEVFIKEEPQ